MPFAIVGAGMVGCAVALALKKRGYDDINIYERRADPRSETSKEVGRSINLAISARGLESLRAIDPALCKFVEKMVVPMRGRMVHSKADGHMSAVLYGINGTESINSVGRADLNNVMIAAVEKAGVKIHFETSAPKSLQELKRLGTTVFGCDGTYSSVRDIVAKNADSKLEIETVPTYYLEVPIEKASNWERNYLHVWPRGSHMFIALPNLDRSYTGTLFAPRSTFETELSQEDSFVRWFTKEFQDAASIVGEKSLRVLANSAPRGKLTSLKFQPYNIDSSVILMGDAAHSMVPFYGQGLNSGLEDVRVLFEEFIDAKFPDPSQWNEAFDEYSRHRKVDCDAINNLSMSNYKEMSSSVATWAFRLRKYLDNGLSRVLGDHWLPLYTMVSFREDVRYSKALEISAKQDKILSFLLFGAGSTIGIASFAFMVKFVKSVSMR